MVYLRHISEPTMSKEGPVARVRMNKEMLKAIDVAVKMGAAMNRSDFIRHAVSEKLERLSILKAGT